MTEGFRPKANKATTGIVSKIMVWPRLILDLQLLTISRHAKTVLPNFTGKVLDVGCGDSPYKTLLNATKTEYTGIDIVDADSFDYSNSTVIPFDGKHIPFDDNLYKGIICTEVLEHVEHYNVLIAEMYRVMAKGGKAFITIPWSARYHYIPYDYFRYTPSSLKTMFSAFEQVKIQTRGNDIAVIGNKLIVMWFRNLLPADKWKYLFTPFWIVTLPVLAIAVAAAHLSLWFKLGSTDDPLGYTIECIK